MLGISKEAIKKWHTANSITNYKLKENEVFSPNRNEVLCKKCSMPLKRLTWSDLICEMYYQLIDNNNCRCTYEENEKQADNARNSFYRKYYDSYMYVKDIKEENRTARLNTITENYMNPDFYDIRDSLDDWVRRYKPGNKGVSITGNVGLGKSTLMACLRNELLDRGFSCIITTVSTMMENTRSRIYTDDFSYEKYDEVDVLIIDDIGADFSEDRFKKSDYNSFLYSKVNYRNSNNMTICYTSNYYKPGLITLGIQESTVDRLYEMIEFSYTLEGESVRKRNGMD